MVLLTAYARLQLDPSDQSRVVAFESLCWHHILNHGSRDWADACWNGSIKLQLWTGKTCSTQGFKSFDSTLNHLVSEFVNAYAAVIWPVDAAKRSHLARVDDKNQGMELKALRGQLSVGQGIRQRFKATQDLDLTAKDALVESKIGQRVRAYMMNLLLYKQLIPHTQSADAGKLLQIILKPPTTSKRAHSKPASALTADSPIDDLYVSSKRSKEEQKPSQEDPAHSRHKNAVRERSNGLLRLRFTFSRTKKLQSIISCPSKPAAGFTKSSDALNRARDFPSTCSGAQNYQSNTITDAYQCWLRNCGEFFQTTKEVLLHVKQKHLMGCGELIMVPSLLDPVTDSTLQHPATVSCPTVRVRSTENETPECNEAPEQDSAVGVSILLQSLQEAEKAGFTFDDEYVALINRYAHA
ncbi:hypothetical protein MBLNU13_g00683t1 [Cladosporium sp. NU13]